MDKAMLSFDRLFHLDFDVVDDGLEQIRVAHTRNKFGLELCHDVEVSIWEVT
jgi:hypothetical protein